MNSAGRGVQGALAILLVVGAVASGSWGIWRALTPRSLDAAAPQTAAAIREQVRRVDSELEVTSGSVEQAVGAQASPEEWAAAGKRAFETTWLSGDDPVVLGVEEVRTRCQSEVAATHQVLNAQTLVVEVGHADPTRAPPVISLEDASRIPARLADCLDDLGRAEADLEAALGSAKSAAALSAAQWVYWAALADLGTALESAKQSLDQTAGKVADDATRTYLSEQSSLAEAKAQIPYHGDGDWAELDSRTADILQATDSLNAAAAAVQDSHNKWLSVQTPYTGGNGRIDPATLCAVPYDPKQLLRCDAEAAWMRLNAVYKAVFGEDIPIDLSYRTYDEQVEMRRIYGTGAAVPGTSNHGWGTAIDLPDYRFGGIGLEWNYGTEKYEWMKLHAPAHGWVNPSWAVQGGIGPAEPWHFEYAR